MSLDIFFIKDYHFFVYTAYLFTFIGCLTLYLRAMRELKRNEYIYVDSLTSTSSVAGEIARKNSNTIPWIKAADSYTSLKKITYAQSCKK